MKTKEFIKKYGPTMLSVISCAGVVGTVVLTVKATPKAIKLIEESKLNKNDDLTGKEIIAAGYKPFIPVILTGVATCACILASNKWMLSRERSLLGAYTLLLNSYKEYKGTNIELYGKENDQCIERRIIEKADIDNDEMMFFEFNSLRFFKSTIHKVMQAECQAKEQLQIVGHLSLNDYYNYLGLEKNIEMDAYAEAFGWSLNQIQTDPSYLEDKLEFIYDREFTEDGIAYYTIRTNIEPTMDWYCF